MHALKGLASFLRHKPTWLLVEERNASELLRFLRLGIRWSKSFFRIMIIYFGVRVRVFALPLFFVQFRFR